MKRLILVFCTDGNAGKALAETLRNDDTTAQLRDAATFDGIIEHCDNAIIMPDVAKWPRERIMAAYAGFVMEPPQMERDEPTVVEVLMGFKPPPIIKWVEVPPLPPIGTPIAPARRGGRPRKVVA